jgi:hypothetical protein
MALVLFAVLVLYGATGMERRRGVAFSTVTAMLLFAWILPIIIEQSASLGTAYLLIDVVVAFVAFQAISLLSYFAGRWGRHLFVRISSIRRTG